MRAKPQDALTTARVRTLPVLVPQLVLVGLFGTLLVGDTTAGGLPLRSVGSVVVLVGTIAMARYPVTSSTWRATPWFITWLTLVALSAAWSPLDARPIEYLIDLAHLGFLLSCTIFIAPRLPDRSLTWVWFLTWATGSIFALAAVTGVGGEIDLQGRRSAFGMGANVFVRVVGLAAIAAIALAWHGRRWPIATLPILVMAAILSGSRGGVLALVVAGIAVTLLALSGTSTRTRRNAVTFLFASAALSYFVLAPVMRDWIQARFIETISSGDSAGRDVILGQALHLWHERPVFGVGLDGYWGAVGIRYGFQHPHNLLLQTFLEAGIIGGAVLVATLAIAFSSAWSVRSGKHSLFACAALLVATSAMFSGTWYDSRFLWFYLVLGAAALARHTAVQDDEVTTRNGRT